MSCRTQCTQVKQCLPRRVYKGSQRNCWKSDPVTNYLGQQVRIQKCAKISEYGDKIVCETIQVCLRWCSLDSNLIYWRNTFIEFKRYPGRRGAPSGGSVPLGPI